MIRWRLSLGAFCVASLVTTALGQSRPEAELIKITHQGVERSALLYVPATAAGRPLPAVLARHGLGGSGEQFRTYAGLDAAAEREKFVAIYPDAVQKAWSYARPFNQPMPTVNGETVDDVGFIRLLIDNLVDRKIADLARVYVTGISRGGLMAFTVACALADRIAAAAPVITGMTDHQREDCRPSRPVPIMVIAGTADQSQPFGGAHRARGAACCRSRRRWSSGVRCTAAPGATAVRCRIAMRTIGRKSC